MAHNALIRGGTGSGAWTAVTTTPTDFETLDQRQFEAVNGDQGGVWAPATAITIGGSGLTVTGPFTVNASTALIEGGTLNVLSSTTFGDTVDFSLTTTFHNTAPAIFNGTLTANAAATFTAGIAVDASSLFTTGTYTFSASGLVVFNGTVTANAGIDVATGLFQIQSPTRPVFGSGLNLSDGGSNLDVQGPSFFFKNITLGSVASILGRDLVGPDADTTIAANTYDRVFVPTLSTTDRNYTLADAPNGTEITISMVSAGGSGSNRCRVRDSGAVSIIDLKDALTSGNAYAARIVRRGGAWYVLDFSVKP